MLLRKELESFETTGDPNAMAELELRSKLVKVNEGLTVLKDMLQTSMYMLDAKFAQIKTISSFPKSMRTFAKFNEVAVKAAIARTISEPRYDLPLLRYRNMDFVQFYGLSAKDKQRAQYKVFTK